MPQLVPQWLLSRWNKIADTSPRRGLRKLLYLYEYTALFTALLYFILTFPQLVLESVQGGLNNLKARRRALFPCKPRHCVKTYSLWTELLLGELSSARDPLRFFCNGVRCERG